MYVLIPHSCTLQRERNMIFYVFIVCTSVVAATLCATWSYRLYFYRILPQPCQYKKRWGGGGLSTFFLFSFLSSSLSPLLSSYFRYTSVEHVSLFILQKKCSINLLCAQFWGFEGRWGIDERGNVYTDSRDRKKQTSWAGSYLRSQVTMATITKVTVLINILVIYLDGTK